MRAFTAVIERCPETGLFVGYVPGLPGAHSQGETLDELNRNLTEVIEMLLEDGEPNLFLGRRGITIMACRPAVTRGARNRHVEPDAHHDRRIVRVDRHVHARPAAGPDGAPGKEPYRPDPATVQRYGPGYRYPQAGWIVLHIEGEPYERGYQHGRLMAPEIADFVEALAAKRSAKAPRPTPGAICGCSSTPSSSGGSTPNTSRK